MINKILNNILTSSSVYLSDSKSKVIEFARKNASNKTPKIPNTQDFINQLQSINIENYDDIQKAEDIYNRFITLINVPISIFEGKKAELESIKSKLNIILSNFQKLNEVTTVINGIIPIIRGIIRVSGNILAAQNPTTGINGKTLKLSFDKIDNLKEKVTKAIDAISSISSSFIYFQSEIASIMGPLDRGLEVIENTLNKLYQLKTQIDNLYKQFLLLISFPEINELLSNNNTTIENFIEEHYETIISEQNVSFRDIIKIYSNNGVNVGYEFTKEQIN
jgi:hypothetical protein